MKCTSMHNERTRRKHWLVLPSKKSRWLLAITTSPPTIARAKGSLVSKLFDHIPSQLMRGRRLSPTNAWLCVPPVAPSDTFFVPPEHPWPSPLSFPRSARSDFHPPVTPGHPSSI